MTHQEFLSLFTKHLYVGGTKRNELIHELQSHLEELTANESPEVKIGNPRQLARRYNREHLGLLGSVGFMYSLPIVVAVLFISMFWGSSYWDSAGIIGSILLIGCILTLPIWVGLRVLQMHQAKRKIFIYVVATPFLAAATIALCSTLVHRIDQQYNFVNVISHLDSPDAPAFSFTNQFLGSLSIIMVGYFFSLVVFLGILLVQGFMKLNVSIFPKKK